MRATLTRPEDTNPYNIGDVISNSTSAPTAVVINLGPDRTAELKIVGGVLVSSNPATPLATSIRVHLFSAVPTLTNDNGAIAMVSGDMANYLGYLDFTNFADLGAFSASRLAVTEAVRFSITTDIWVVFETRSAYTPISAEQFRVDLFTS